MSVHDEVTVRDRIVEIFETQSRTQRLSLEVVAEIDSTNRYVLELAAGGAPTGTACLARTQTKGRGRRGKGWVGPSGNIYLSLLWRFHNSFEALSGLSLAVGVAVAELALVDYGVEGVALKWPNDVMHKGAKMCGILVETTAPRNDEIAAVVGVGLNVTMEQEAAQKIAQQWTDLSTATGSVMSYEDVAGRLLARLFTALAAFERDGLDTLRQRWNQFDALMGREVVATGSHDETRGRAKGIDATGALLIDVNGVEHRVLSGEVSLRPAS